MIGGSVALVAPRYAPAPGGIERTVEELARRLAARGQRVEVITTDPSGRLPWLEERDGVLVRRFPTVADDAVFFVAPELGRWLMRNAAQFALVHAHSYHTPLALQAAAAARAAGVPLVLSPYYHGTGHSPLRRALHLPYRLAGAWVIRQARRLIYMSQTERALLERHFGPSPHTVAPCGVDLATLRMAAPVRRDPRRVTVLAAGRMERYKRTDRLVAALEHLPPEYELVVVGGGPLRARVERMAARMGARERLRLLGHVSQAELLGWYGAADVFVSLSERESFGLTVLEAAAAGAAVAASDIPAHRELAGYLPEGRVTLVPPGADAAALARAVVAAAGQGRAADADRWLLPTWDGMVDGVLATYREALGHARAAGVAAAGQERYAGDE